MAREKEPTIEELEALEQETGGSVEVDAKVVYATTLHKKNDANIVEIGIHFMSPDLEITKTIAKFNLPLNMAGSFADELRSFVDTKLEEIREAEETLPLVAAPVN